jgi:hypothetical protein
MLSTSLAGRIWLRGFLNQGVLAMKSSFSRCVALAVAVAMVAVSTGAANADLVHWYKLDDTGSSNYAAVDSAGSVNGNLASTSIHRGYQETAPPAALWNAGGRIGGALQFIAANNDGVSMPDYLLGSSYTIAAWIKGSSFSTTGDAENIIFSDYNPAAAGRMLFEVRNGELCVFEGGAGGGGAKSGGGALQTDTWYHVAVTNNNKAVTLYLNGNAVSTSTFGYSALGGSNDLGALLPYDGATSYTNGFDGLIDDVRFYNTALSQSEVQTLANTPEPSTCILLLCGMVSVAAYAWRKRK